MSRGSFVPAGFQPHTALHTGQFLLEPLGPQHNEADHAAWTSSIEHIRATAGYPDGDWPPLDGMSLEANLADLSRHATDFASGRGFTFTVRDPVDGQVIGCVYLYPPEGDGDVIVQSWVRADRSHLDRPWPTPSPPGSPPSGRGDDRTAAGADRTTAWPRRERTWTGRVLDALHSRSRVRMTGLDPRAG